MIGVVGRGQAHTSRLVERIEAAGYQVEILDVSALNPATVDYVVVSGDHTLIDLVHAEVTIPAIPVKTGRGVPAFEPSALPAAINHLTRTPDMVRNYPLLSVTCSGTQIERALFDVTVVTDVPTKISEYEVVTSRVTNRFRADGVVVATPLGSHGYAHAVGGPRIAPDTSAVSIVPIAEFSLATDRWVFPIVFDITVRCVRDETPVGLYLDGRRARSVTTTDRVTITRAGDFPLVTPKEFGECSPSGLEKL